MTSMPFLRYRCVPPVVLAVAAFLVVACGRMDPASLHGTWIEPPMPTKDFVLTSADGPVALEDFRDRIVVLSFGYTSCPLVCPTTMGRLARAMDLLGPASDLVQVVLVSVDPERDTPERLVEYLAKFDDRFVGVTGTKDQISEAAASYGIYHEFPETEEDRAELGHSAQTIVLDRQGRVVLIWPYEVKPEDVAADLGLLLERL